ncbi:F510_1955 family glycosylhydrolase [Desertibacillus haloalkaliphilus]|uniref:F510_1955 family glycosylhydrolase n=1 Tax=Desertibacillus haloalkaliphilus TaxID=1328930 RepID=UPI001C2662DF|nr:hypothetical protein [Desertibacillus haloalkaliphilus]MBU8906280.1 hypothetical protein [Desertibacillus haloalkaliphilus]
MKFNMRLPLLASVLVTGAILAGCGAEDQPSEQPEDVPVQEEVGSYNEEENKNEEERPTIEFGERVDEVSHIHGLEIHPANENDILVATHYGLITLTDEGEAFLVGGTLDDYMGFSRVADSDKLMTSGHPGPGSELPDPLGFLWSEDYGQTWEVRSLLGEVDFHALTANNANAEKIIGFATDYTDNFSTALYLTTDQGATWEELPVTGLPIDHHDLFDLAYSPENDDILYAATAEGLMVSENGGLDWEVKVDGPVSALHVLGDEDVIFYHTLAGQGLMHLNGEELISYDLLYTDDFVNYIATPNPEDPSNVYVTTAAKDMVLQTNDYGQTWNTLVNEGKIE